MALDSYYNYMNTICMMEWDKWNKQCCTASHIYMIQYTDRDYDTMIHKTGNNVPRISLQSVSMDLPGPMTSWPAKDNHRVAKDTCCMAG